MLATFRRLRKPLAVVLAVLLLPALAAALWHLVAPRPRAAWHAGAESWPRTFSPGKKARRRSRRPRLRRPCR